MYMNIDRMLASGSVPAKAEPLTRVGLTCYVCISLCCGLIQVVMQSIEEKEETHKTAVQELGHNNTNFLVQDTMFLIYLTS